MQTAAYGWSLCLILTLWMTGSRPPTVVAPRSPDSSPWWDQASIHIQTEALRLRNAGDFHGAEQLYRQGYQEAVRIGDKLAEVRYLTSVGGCQLLAYHYRDALSTFLQARDVAAAIGDSQDLGAIAVNLSSLYLQVWDVPAAMRAASEGLLAESPQAAAGKRGHSYFEASLLVQLGRIHALLGDSRAARDYAAGIEAARAQENARNIEAIGWDLLGEQDLAAENFAGAEKSFLEAFRLRKLFRSAESGLSYGRLGTLALAQGNLEVASQMTNRAMAARRRGQPALPEHMLLHQRGRIRLALGQVDAALSDFSSALDATAGWRLEVPTARSALTGANVGLNEQIFRSFIETAAEQSLRTGNQAWAQRAFAAVELNRAASLRGSLALAEVWNKNLPPQYWEILGQLSAEQGRGLHNSQSNAKSDGLHLRLTEMEAEAARGLNPKKEENFRARTSLIHFRDGLRDSELFLSFWLGKKESYLWAADRNSLRLYRLASEPEIVKAVQAFREALPAGGTEAIGQGQRLYQLLFGQLGPRETRKTAWLLSIEGALFDVPFAALVTNRGNTEYLVEKHSRADRSGSTAVRRVHGPFGARR